MCNHASQGLPHPATSPAGSSAEGEGVAEESVCNKVLLWGKAHSDWLGLAHQWVDLAPKWMGLCAPAQSCEIHRLVPNKCISID
jgi:hypothetical protein